MAATFHIVNLGCKVNRVESDSFHDALGRIGFAPTDAESADVVVINTCTVTAVAEKKARKAVRHALAVNERARVIVTGCASAIDQDEFSRMSDRVDVIPKALMIERLTALRPDTPPSETDALKAGGLAPEGFVPGRERFGLKVQDGCSNECAYCIVRVARGPETSEPLERVLAGARAMSAAGIPEIVLTGINLGRYDWKGTGLTALLEALLSENLTSRIRLSSIEPDNVTDGLIELIARAEGRVCRHLHLPLQSGSSKVLREMNRHYDRDEFLATVQSVRTRIPAVSLTTDVIVGFPGETEQDFEQSVEMCRACGFSKIHVFPYSERAGTEAAARTDQVLKDERARRAARLRAVADQLRADDLAARAGTVELAAVESATRATTESYHEVAPPEGARTGTLVEVVL